MDIYIKDIQQTEYQLMPSKIPILSKLYQKPTFDPIPRLKFTGESKVQTRNIVYEITHQFLTI